MTVYDTSFGIDLLHENSWKQDATQLRNPLPRGKKKPQFLDL